MYIPKAFNIKDEKEIHSFIEANAFGQLISQVDGKLFSSHLPFLLREDKNFISCHVAIQNPQWENIDGQNILITMQGPHAYISPTWYDLPGVPTWNFQAVHINGVAKTFHEPRQLKVTVEALSKKYESGFEQPWQPEYSDKLLGAIVGIEIEIENIECKFKLNQNRTDSDRKGVISQLEKNGETEIAQAMKRTLKG